MDLEFSVDNLIPLPGKILVDEIDTGERVHNGVIRLSDNMKESGIRPRWCRVFKVAQDIEEDELCGEPCGDPVDKSFNVPIKKDKL
jgi:hypothetical protein